MIAGLLDSPRCVNLFNVAFYPVRYHLSPARHREHDFHGFRDFIKVL